MGATLLAPEALLSHRSAAEATRLREPTGGAVHITAPRQLARHRRALTTHLATVPADERTAVDGIPTTSLSRTLLDLAATEGEESLTRALRQAHFEGLTDRLSLADLLARYPGRRGTAVVGRVLDDGAYSLRTRSGLEDSFLEFLAARGLPRPETNATVEVGETRFEVDCLWRRHRLVVELDTYSTHGSRRTIEADRRRDGLLQSHAFSVHRFTDRRLGTDPDGIDRQLRAAFSARPSGPPSRAR